jgi:GTP cyclohydrolase I
MEDGVRLLLQGMGMNLEDPDFKGTPARVARLWAAALTPRKMRRHEASFPATYSEMIVLRHHKVITFCPHHLLPVEMIVSVGYLPGGKMLGLSKLARIAESVLTKPMKQEEYTDRVAFDMHTLCNPKGVGVYVSARHGCMVHRGIRTDGDVVTTVMRGQFLMNAATRNEFLEIVRASGPRT